MPDSKEFPIKTRIVNVTNKKTGVKYQEERQYQYDPAKGYNVVISSRRIGKKIPKGQEEAVRCRPKKSKKQIEDTSFSATRKRIGATDIVSLAGRSTGLEAAVRTAYPVGGTAEKLLSVAQYLVITGNTVHNIGAWQCNHNLPYVEGMSENICYDLFDSLGHDETGMQMLFQTLAALAGDAERRQMSIAFDSTSSSQYGEGLKPYARQGFNKAGDGLDMYKLATFVSIKTGLPVSFEMQPGNIPDVSSLFNALKRVKSYGLYNPELVLDNGFFSKKNISLFLRNNVKFTILATLDDKWI